MRYVSGGMCMILAGALLVSGCGPTKTGVKVRSDAHDRLNLVNAQVSYDQARRSFETGQFDRALREVETAIARHSEAPLYHLLRGRILMEMHQLERAMQSFDRTLDIDPDHADALYFKGIVYQRWSNHERAAENYLAAFEADQTNVQYLLAAAESMIALNQLEQAQSLVMPRVAYFEHNAALRHLMGQIALLQGDPQTASTLLGEARLLNPDDMMLLEELAWAQYDAGQYSRCYESIRELRRASNETRPDLLRLEAQCLVHMDRPIEARNIYLELSQLEPGEVDIWIELGALALDLGDMRRVALSGTRAIAVAPDRHEGYLLRAVFEKHEGNLQRAENLLRDVIARSPQNVMPHLLLGQVLESMKAYDEALASYAQAIRLQPDNREAHALFTQLSERQELSSVPVR